jgi:uncharacterized membrane protein
MQIILYGLWQEWLVLSLVWVGVLRHLLEQSTLFGHLCAETEKTTALAFHVVVVVGVGPGTSNTILLSSTSTETAKQT